MDLISRQQAIKAIKESFIQIFQSNANGPLDLDSVTHVTHILNSLPSEGHKTGYWVKADSAQYFRKHYPAYTCSCCNFRKEGRWNFCPNCGAEIVGLIRGENNERKSS